VPGRSTLERIVNERAGQRRVGSVSVAIERIAEEIACEARADVTFRRTIRKFVRRRSQELLSQLGQDGKPSKERPRRTRRSPAR